MNKFTTFAAIAALCAAGAAHAAEPPLQVSYPADAGLDCAGLQAELARVEAIIGQANGSVAGAQGSARAAELGASAAINGALYSGALGRVPGLGAFGNAAANAAKQRAAAKQKEAEAQIRVAETRRAMLIGLSAGKSCGSALAVPAPQAPASDSAAGGAIIPALPAAATKHY